MVYQHLDAKAQHRAFPYFLKIGRRFPNARRLSVSFRFGDGGGQG
jgi:hypothetical protein